MHARVHGENLERESSFIHLFPSFILRKANSRLWSPFGSGFILVWANSFCIACIAFSPLKNVFFENEQTEQRGNPYFLSKTKITMVQDENDNNRRQVMVKGWARIDYDDDDGWRWLLTASGVFLFRDIVNARVVYIIIEVALFYVLFQAVTWGWRRRRWQRRRRRP